MHLSNGINRMVEEGDTILFQGALLKAVHEPYVHCTECSMFEEVCMSDDKVKWRCDNIIWVEKE